MSGRLRVVLFTPHSPIEIHDHAANDIALNFATALGGLVDLHVYSPRQGRSPANVNVNDLGFTTHIGAMAQQPNPLLRLSPYPYSFRWRWAAHNTRELVRLCERLQPDAVLCEYIQPADALVKLARKYPAFMTLHDLNADAFKRGVEGPVFSPRGWYQSLEYHRIRRAEVTAVRAARHVFTYSDRDAVKASEIGARSVSVTQIGVDLPSEAWSADSSIENSIVFIGAMWRRANELSALFLAEQVMPRVWARLPTATLRIVGARPSPALQELPVRDQRISVAGEVPDLDLEMRGAAAIACPTVVEAGVLLKSLRALAIGAPVVLNERAAAPLIGLRDGEHAVVTRDASFAEGLLGLLGDRAMASTIGRGGRDYVSQTFTWTRCAHSYVTEIEKRIGVREAGS